ncbi:fibrinogen silencer-binding protein-like [Aphis craccivora]|uniref:Regulatory protein zeste n=1 Tax=Aphis craccivora TaxID=307492 RepID=A0A6G0W404_APHCR|nr:fibrinogen silencer-binding protein-like [Aphis craccivora]
MSSNKRNRATNFSFEEKELLLKYAIENKSVLENKVSNSVSWKDKNQCWLKISEAYNSTTSGCPRDATSLRLKYEGLKRLLRGSKSNLFKTGGGPHENDYTCSSELEKQLYNIIQLSVEGLPSKFDSDAVVNISNIDEEHEVENEIIDESAVDMFAQYDFVFDNNNEDLSTIIVGQSDKGMEKEPTVEKNWAPIDSTKLLKSTGKHQKLNTTGNLKRKNHSQASVSEKFTLLAEKKMELIEMQKSMLTIELEFLKNKHALELNLLELDISLKKQKLDNDRK